MKAGWLVCIILLVLGVPGFASSPCLMHAQASIDQASALQFEQKWLATLQRRDAAALDCMLDDGFVDTSYRGELRPKTQVLRELPYNRNDEYRQTLTDMEAYLFGNAAVVHGINVVSDQQGHEVARIRFTDVLRFINHQWYAVAAQETMMQQTKAPSPQSQSQQQKH